MNLDGVVTGILAVVHGLTPAYAPDHPFRVHPEDDAAGLESVAATHTRRFAVEAVGAPMEGRFISQGGLDYPEQMFALRVAYARQDFRTDRDLASAMASDLVQLVNALGPVSAWSTWASEFYVDATEPERQDIADAGGERIIASILTIRLRAIWSAT